MSWSIKFTLAAEAYGLSYRGRPAPRSIGRVHLSLHVALANRLPLSGALFFRPQGVIRGGVGALFTPLQTHRPLRSVRTPVLVQTE